ncbi:hypothetical protein D3C85_1687730 [compost metagenome]
MTFNDEEQLKRILIRFRADSLNDSGEIQEAMLQNDQTQLRLLMHRVAGRIAQIGSKKLSSEFRLMEMQLASEGLDEHKKYSINTLLKQLDLLLTQLKK